MIYIYPSTIFHRCFCWLKEVKKMPSSFDIPANYGVDVFDDEEMRSHLPEKVYRDLMDTIHNGKELDPSLADDVAHGMKDWAISKGATHYTHWFQPLTGVTAEKHDSFISVPNKKGKVIMSFSGKELIKGEPDASSFPNGGLRATFEARGYTAWDCTSPAFVVHDEYSNVLFIPTAFCSYTGEALDSKTPLLRSMEYVSEQAVRVLRIFGDTETTKVVPMAGPEQEYFLVDIDHFAQRKDLIYTGRTLFGAPAPKGQELDDHYFGPIREQIAGFMTEVNQVLWKLGIPAKTEHNEVAPSQHELAVIYGSANVASDQNALVMMILKKIAKKHGFICLFAEKPFAGINGSGKHDNWSLQTNTGINLLKPGKNPHENTQFLAFLAAVVKAVDEYAGLMRESVATYTNDFRLGANEAPPAIVSIFLGDELNAVVEKIIHANTTSKVRANSLLQTGAKTLPVLPKDSTDRNRTSPFAFTGNRFEFRMVGSSQNVANANIILDTIIGKALKEFADFVENSEDATKAIDEWIKTTLKEHERIIFNGDGYSEDWVKEAEKRGLLNLKTTVEATDVLNEEKTKELFTESGIMTLSELKSRAEIKYSNYASQVFIDAKTMSHMAHKLYIPAVNGYFTDLVKEAKDCASISIKAPKSTMSAIEKISSLLDKTVDAVNKLDDAIASCDVTGRDKAVYARDVLLPLMADLRAPVDELETIVSKKVWPVPSYGDLLFHIN
jgi:glutamine synthetase